MHMPAHTVFIFSQKLVRITSGFIHELSVWTVVVISQNHNHIFVHRKPLCQKILSFPSPLDVLTSRIQNTLTCQIFFLFLNWDLIDTQLYLGFRCTTCWSSISKYCEIITITSLHILTKLFYDDDHSWDLFSQKLPDMQYSITSCSHHTVHDTSTTYFLYSLFLHSSHCLTPFTRLTQPPHHHQQPSLFSVSLSFFLRLHV